MKKKIVLLTVAIMLAIGLFAGVTSCVGFDPNAPSIGVSMPELFSPDPDKAGYKFPIAIKVNHPAKIKDWQIQINRNTGRQASGDGAQAQRPAAQQPAADGEQRQPRQRRAFFEQTGTGNLPKKFEWDGKGSSRTNRQGETVAGEMVQSATEYRLDISATDVNGEKISYEGIINVDVLVVRDGENLRIIVPSIVFPGNSADLSSASISDDDKRSNRRVIQLIARVLNRFADYAITVEGHANPTSDNPPDREKAADRTLSEARANAVIDALSSGENTTRKDRMTAVGMGTDRTVAEWDDDDENWKNRRVEFILHK